MKTERLFTGGERHGEKSAAIQQPAAVETESEATVKMAADLTCIDMKTGEVIYKTVIDHSATEKNKWTAEQKCRKVLAEKATEALIYGM